MNKFSYLSFIEKLAKTNLSITAQKKQKLTTTMSNFVRFGERKFKREHYEAEHNLRRHETKWFQFVTSQNMIQFGSMKKENGDQTVKTVSPDFSHTLLAGGILNIPIERYKELLCAVSQDIKNNFVPDFNEIAPPITRLYMDLDFKDKLAPGGLQLYSERPVTEFENGTGTEMFPAIQVIEEGLERRCYDNILVADCIASKVTEYFPSVDKASKFFYVHCLWRPSRFKTEEINYVNANGKHVREVVISERSFGLHMVWPNLHVTLSQALDIREGVIRALAARFYNKNSANNRSQPGTNSWQEVVDENVYLPLASLRMVLSDKYETCKDCKTRNNRLFGSNVVPRKRKADEAAGADAIPDPMSDYRSHCPCHGSGKRPVNSIYSYRATVSGDHQEMTKGVAKSFEDSVYSMLLQCCIRDPNRPDLIRNNEFAPTDPVMVIPPDAPRYKGFKPSAADSFHKTEEKFEKFKTTTTNSTRTYIGLKDTVEFSVDSREFTAVQNLFINADSVVQQAKRNAKSGTAILDLTVYKKIIVHRLRRCCLNGHYYYLVDVTDSGTNTDSKFCFNVKRVHNCEQNVYFKITEKNGIMQECNCFSTKNVISCQNFQSPPCALPKNCYNVLFSKELLQKGQDEQKANIVATSLRKSRSILEMSREKIDAEIEKPFLTVALDHADANTLKEFARKNAIEPILIDEQTGIVSSSQSPLDPIEDVKDQKYAELCKGDYTVAIQEIEQVKVIEPSRPEITENVKTVVDKLKKIESKSARAERPIKNKLLEAFEETFSLAYQPEQ